jgi:hypothetical protein
MVNRPDLLERALVIELPIIPDGSRRTEEEVWKRLEEERPRLLGALLDAVSAGLRDLPSIQFEHLPRMADFARWVEACGGALGWGRGEFIATYQELRGELDDQALSLWPVYPVLLRLLEKEPVFKGTVGHLLERLTSAGKERDGVWSSDWPRHAKALGTEMRRYAPNLRRLGVEVTWPKKKRSNRGYLVEIHRTGGDLATPLVPGPR